MKTKCVLFTKDNARILTNPDMSHYADMMIVSDPDLSSVEGIPLHYWKLVDGQILPMTDEEKAVRDGQIAVANPIAPVATKTIYVDRPIETVVEKQVFIDRPVEVYKDVEVEKVVYKDKIVVMDKIVDRPIVRYKTVYYIPNYIKLIMLVQLVVIAVLSAKK